MLGPQGGGWLDLGEYPGQQEFNYLLRGLHMYASTNLVQFRSAALWIPIGIESREQQVLEQFYNGRYGTPSKNIFPEYMVLVGKGTSTNVPLDGLHVHNVVWENVNIAYNGGPVILENTIFVNCTFSLPANADTQTFAQAVLEKASVTLTRKTT
jgi:hypothetical protein